MTLEVRTVGHRTAALKPQRLMVTLEALTLGGTDDVDLSDIGEVCDGDDVANRCAPRQNVNANLAKVTNRLDAGLGKVTSHGLVDVLGLDIAETDLDGIVAVGRRQILTCETAQGPAWMTVTGTTLSFSSQTWVMPILRPRIMLIMYDLQLSVVLGQCERPLRSPLADHN